MGLFDKVTKPQIPAFQTRSEAFDYMLAHLAEQGVELEEAASRANTFADIVARNKKLPHVPEKPKTPIEKGIVFVQQIAEVKKQYPEVWDIVTGAIGGLIGGFTGASVATNNQEITREDIDFDNLT